jgi:hypothetical protein
VEGGEAAGLEGNLSGMCHNARWIFIVVVVQSFHIALMDMSSLCSFES